MEEINANIVEQVVMENILSRSSVRTYEDRPVEEAKVEELLRAGMAAPSGVDHRPWHLVVVTDQALREGLAQANPYAGYVKRAPLAIVVCGDMNKAGQGRDRDLWIQDCSAVTENILLAAHGIGLGATWTATYPIEERCQAVARVLNLPAHLVAFCTIVVGYPRGEAHVKDKWDPTAVTLNAFK